MAVRKNTNKSSLMLTEIAIKGIQDKKGKDITTISLKEIEELDLENFDEEVHEKLKVKGK